MGQQQTHRMTLGLPKIGQTLGQNQTCAVIAAQAVSVSDYEQEGRRCSHGLLKSNVYCELRAA